MTAAALLTSAEELEAVGNIVAAILKDLSKRLKIMAEDLPARRARTAAAQAMLASMQCKSREVMVRPGADSPRRPE